MPGPTHRPAPSDRLLFATCLLHAGAAALLLACGCGGEPKTETKVQSAPPAANVPAHCIRPGGALDSALATRQAGCPCDEKLQRPTCIDGVALMCEQGQWLSVTDGACGEHSTDKPAACIAGTDCSCQGSACYIMRDRSHACVEGRWREVALANCWHR
jgi:hypothetical protein